MARGPGAQHEEQLQRLGDAAVRVLARDGLPALTFRTVAAEAGVSPGRVQHYARTSRGLATLTFRHIQELTRQRVHEAVASIPEATPKDLILATLRSLIPCGDEERTVMQVGTAVEMHALTDPKLAEELREGRSVLLRFLAEQLGDAASSGRRQDSSSLSGAATMLLATAEGLSNLTMSRTIDSAEAIRLIDMSTTAALEHISTADP